MRRLLIALLPFCLTGCWTGFNLYSASDARPAIPPGVYRANTEEAADKVYRVSVLPNGMTRFDGGEKNLTYGFAPLDRSTFVAWMQLDGEPPAVAEKHEPNQIYGLMVHQPDDAFVIYAPSCSDAAGNVAKRSGAAIESGTPPSCNFTSRASLERALHEVPRDDADALTLRRIP